MTRLWWRGRLVQGTPDPVSTQADSGLADLRDEMNARLENLQRELEMSRVDERQEDE